MWTSYPGGSSNTPSRKKELGAGSMGLFTICIFIHTYTYIC